MQRWQSVGMELRIASVAAVQLSLLAHASRTLVPYIKAAKSAPEDRIGLPNILIIRLIPGEVVLS